MDLKKGDRIELVQMLDDPCPIEPETKGTVQFVSAMFPPTSRTPTSVNQYKVSVKWDNGRNLLLVVPPDIYRKL
jgi:hypothetical protein